MKVLDQAVFACFTCHKRGGTQMVVLTDAFTYVFVLVCECGAENHFKLNDILGSLAPKLEAEGSKRVN